MHISNAADALLAHIKALTGFSGAGLAVAVKGNYMLLLFGEKRGGDFGRVGVEDNAGEAFYIRLKTGVLSSAPINKRRGACSYVNTVTAPMRLVAMSHVHGHGVLASCFTDAINGFKHLRFVSDGKTLDKVRANVRATNLDFASIVLQETADEDKTGGESGAPSGWEGNMQVIAVDFDLVYTEEVDCSPCAPEAACAATC